MTGIIPPRCSIYNQYPAFLTSLRTIYVLLVPRAFLLAPTLLRYMITWWLLVTTDWLKGISNYSIKDWFISSLLLPTGMICKQDDASLLYVSKVKGGWATNVLYVLRRSCYAYRAPGYNAGVRPMIYFITLGPLIIYRNSPWTGARCMLITLNRRFPTDCRRAGCSYLLSLLAANSLRFFRVDPDLWVRDVNPHLIELRLCGHC